MTALKVPDLTFKMAFDGSGKQKRRILTEPGCAAFFVLPFLKDPSGAFSPLLSETSDYGIM